MTEINKKNEKQASKEPKEKILKITTNQEKKALAKKYQRRRKKKDKSNKIISDFAQQYDRDERTINRYLEEGKALIEQEHTRPYRKELAWQKHLDDLKECGNQILWNAQILMAYRNAQVEENLNVLDYGTIREVESGAEDQLKMVNGYLATQFLVHFQQIYPKTTIENLSKWTWEDVTNRTVSNVLISQIEIVLGKPFLDCLQCPECKNIHKMK